jgi:hypothetical protein
MNTTMAAAFAILVSVSAHAAPLCSAEDVREAKTNLAGFKQALDAGVIPLTVYLDHERPVIMTQYCAGEISKESYCRSLTKNWKEQMTIARYTYQRGMRTAAFEKYVVGMNALQSLCGESASITNLGDDK